MRSLILVAGIAGAIVLDHAIDGTAGFFAGLATGIVVAILVPAIWHALQG
jgi:hypothetical protein